ncbi:transposable element Tc1 transposase [Trichonephila clavipes]|nr:transposable element Tc1 transposase [Trichonephila clavipes]
MIVNSRAVGQFLVLKYKVADYLALYSLSKDGTSPGSLLEIKWERGSQTALARQQVATRNVFPIVVVENSKIHSTSKKCCDHPASTDYSPGCIRFFKWDLTSDSRQTDHLTGTTAHAPQAVYLFLVKDIEGLLSKSEFDRGRIIAYRDCGLSFREIGQRVGRNQATVMQIYHCWMQERTTDRRRRSLSPRCTTAREDRWIVHMEMMDRAATSRTIAH